MSKQVKRRINMIIYWDEKMTSIHKNIATWIVLIVIMTLRKHVQYAILSNGIRADIGLKCWLGVDLKWLPSQSTDIFYTLNACNIDWLSTDCAQDTSCRKTSIISVMVYTTWQKRLAKSWLGYSDDVSIDATESFNRSIAWKIEIPDMHTCLHLCIFLDIQ